MAALLTYAALALLSSAGDLDGSSQNLVDFTMAISGLYIGFEALIAPRGSALYRLNNVVFRVVLRKEPYPIGIFRVGGLIAIVVHAVISWFTIRQLLGF